MNRQILPGSILYALLALTILIYWPGLSGPLLLDDFENLRSVADWSAGYTTWRDVLTTSSSSSLGRPIAILSFIANEWASPGDIWAYKYTNLMIHLLCGSLIFWLCGRLLQEHSLAPHRWMVASLVTAFWLLTPLQVSTVLYVVQRMAQLATLFMLAGLVTYVIGRQNLESRPKLGFGLTLSCFLLWLPIAILSKENGALLLPLMFVIEIYFFRFHAPKTGKRLLVSFYILTLLLPILALTVKLFLDPDFILGAYQKRDFTLDERLLTQARILFVYLRTLLIPYGPGLGLYHDDFIKSTSLLVPFTTLISVMAWIMIVAMSVYSLKTKTGILNKLSYIFFGFIFFLTAQLLESSILPLELYFEHRNYLPAVGIYISLSIAICYLIFCLKKQKFFAVLFALLPVTHGLASYSRIQNWTSWEQIIFSSALAHPNSARIHGDLAIYYLFNHGDSEKVFFHLDEVDRSNPRLMASTALMSIAVRCIMDLPIGDAEYQRLQSRLIGKNSTNNILHAFSILIQQKTCHQLDFPRFIEIIEQWLAQSFIKQHPDIEWRARIEIGKFFYYNNLISEAIQQMDKAMVTIPERLEPRLIKLQYLLILNDVAAAKKTLSELKYYNNGQRVDFNLAIKYFNSLLIDKATKNN